MKLRSVAQTLSLVFMALSCAAQQPTPAGRQLAAWLAAYDSTSWDAYLKFLQTNFATPPSGGFRDPALRDRTGGYDLKKIEVESSTEVTALVQERGGDGFARLALEVEPAQPHRILKLSINLVERPAEFALPHMSDSQLVAALHKRLESEASAGRFSGAVLVAKEGKPIFAQAYGNTLQTLFSIASMNKMFTAVATMQLVQAGKLSLDDTLEKYLTDYPNKDLAAKVTIGELLTNTGGTGDIWGPDYDAHRLELRTPQDYIHLYGARALRFEPGSRWEYSNYGFILLGAVIEKVSGETYSSYVREHVYIPAGMASTEPGNTGTPAGGGYSTVGDLLRFAEALRLNKLLNEHYTKLLTTGRVVTPFGHDAYGFGVQSINGDQCFGHNGRSRGLNGDLEICRNSTYTIVALANTDPPAAETISQFIMARLPPPNPK